MSYSNLVQSTSSENNIVSNAESNDIQLDDFTLKDTNIKCNKTYSIERNYSTLLSMFPNVESKYIKKICIELPFIESEGDSLDKLVNHLLNYVEQNNCDNKDLLCSIKEEYEDIMVTMNDQIISEELQMQNYEEEIMEKENNERLTTELIYQQKFEILQNILPDADPNYLRDNIEKYHGKDDLIEEFVALNLMDRNYQKRDQYYAKLKIKETIEQYTTKFNVNKFIKQFPEPFEYFENPERKGIKQDEALNFLLNRYNFNDDYVKKIYNLTRYNLSLADKELRKVCKVNNTNESNIKFDNTLLLQEIAFINNQACIKKHLQVIKEKEEQEWSLLRAQNLLLECQCCYDNVKPTELVECENNHIFCKRCVIKGTDLAISNGLTSVICFMGTACNSEFSLNLLRKILLPSTFEVLLNKRQEFEIKTANLDGLVNCPFCPYSMILTPQIQIFICKNPECMKISCRLCKKINHLPIKCQDVFDEHNGRLFVEEEMTKGLIVYCTSCKIPFVKSSGCNHMICRCGASMCYICKKPWNNFNHDMCRINSTIFEKNQIEMKRVQALSKIHTDFPNLKFPNL